MFSTGLSSAYLANWVIQQYGKENTVLFFTDTLWEDEDNYRFMYEVSKYLGLPITTYTDGRSPDEVFTERRLIKTYYTAPCSLELKMKQTVIFVETLRLEGYEPILYFGIGHKEKQRAPRIAKNYAHHCIEKVRCRFPFIKIDKGNRLNNDYFTQVIQEQWGIKRPRMYEYGFSHANCGGRYVKAGIKHYELLFKVWPERFKQQEEMERKFMRDINEYTILKRNGKPYSLEELRKEIERNKGSQLSFSDYEDIPCACVV